MYNIHRADLVDILFDAGRRKASGSARDV